MSFLSPAFLFGAVAITIPIVLHLLKKERAVRMAFSDVRFLKQAPVTQAMRRRLRELLLLALRVFALLLLTLAFAGPFFDASRLDRQVTIITIDRSLSMSAPGQLDRARDLAQSVLAETPAGHLVGVMAFDDGSEVVQAPTANRRLAEAALERVAASPGSTRYAGALSAAAELIGSRKGRIVVVTDLQRVGWEDDTSVAIPPKVVVDIADVGRVESNLAVTALDRSPVGLIGVVLNTASAPRESSVSLVVDDEVVEVREVIFQPGSNDVRFDTAMLLTGVAVLTVDDATGYAWDDVRYALLDSPEPAPLLVVANGGHLAASAFYLERALLVGEESAPFDLRPVSPDALVSVAREDWNATVAVLLVGTQGLDRRGRDLIASFVASGGGLLIVAGPAVDPDLVVDVLGDTTVVALSPRGAEGDRSVVVTDVRHPIFRAFGELVGTLGQVRFRRTTQLKEVDGTRALARFDDGTPALLEYRVGAGRALVFASDLNNEWNDFPRRPSFVPFVHELARYLAGVWERPREFWIADAPDGSRSEPGVATLAGSGRRVVVNVDPRESVSERLSRDAFLVRLEEGAVEANAAKVSDEVVTREAEQNYWWYALLVLLVLLVAEAWLGRTMA